MSLVRLIKALYRQLVCEQAKKTHESSKLIQLCGEKIQN